MKRRANATYFISAGEFSGDLLAAELVYALRAVQPSAQPFGMTGRTMRQAGVISLVDQSDFAVMGVFDIARRLGDLRRTEQYLLNKIEEYNPSFAVLVDFPGLHFRLAEQLRLRGIPVFQYVAPKVWAWGAKRLPLLRRDFTKVLGVLPFEEEFFLKHKVKYSYIGTPHIDRCDKIHLERSQLGLKSGVPTLAILPGSRKTEIIRILPRLLDITALIRESIPNLQVLMPLSANHDIASLQEFDARLRDAKCISEGIYQVGGIIVTNGMSLEVMQNADAAIVASGTATLECALLGTPMAVAYVIDQTSYEIAKAAVTVKYVSLVNLILDRPVVKEFLQLFNDEDVAAEICELLLDTPHRRDMLDAFQQMRSQMHGQAAQHAAIAIQEELEGRGIGG